MHLAQHFYRVIMLRRFVFYTRMFNCFAFLLFSYLFLFSIRVIDHDQVEDIELVIELDTELHAVLEQSLQDHVTGAVRRVARATHGSFSVVSRVTTESTLVDFSIGRPVEGKPHVF